MTTTVRFKNIELFEHKLEVINRRLAKYGFDPIVVGQYHPVTLQNKVIALEADIEVDFLTLVGGWTLVGTVDHNENLTYCVPGKEIPARYLETAECEHCKRIRNRNTTIIVEDVATGKLMQVGRSCVKDFLGFEPGRMLAQLDLVKEIEGLNDEGYIPSSSIAFPLAYFLNLTCQVIHTYGWMSATDARNEGKDSTAQIVKILDFDQHSPRWDRVKERNEGVDFESEVIEIVAWLKELKGESDYVRNLHQIGTNGFATEKSAGLAASAVIAYRRAMEKRHQNALKANSKWVGTLKEKVQVTAQCIRIYDSANDWGAVYIHTFISTDGNVFVWKASNERLDLGVTYNIKGTVVEHDEYQSVKQTRLTRCKCEVVMSSKLQGP